MYYFSRRDGDAPDAHGEVALRRRVAEGAPPSRGGGASLLDPALAAEAEVSTREVEHLHRLSPAADAPVKALGGKLFPGGGQIPDDAKGGGGDLGDGGAPVHHHPLTREQEEDREDQATEEERHRSLHVDIPLEEVVLSLQEVHLANEPQRVPQPFGRPHMLYIYPRRRASHSPSIPRFIFFFFALFPSSSPLSLPLFFSSPHPMEYLLPRRR